MHIRTKFVSLPAVVVWSVCDVRVVMEMVECFLHGEVSLHKPLHQLPLHVCSSLMHSHRL